MSKQIPLSQGKFAIIDDEDYEQLKQFTWHAIKRRYCCYAYRSRNGKEMSMHRIIMDPPKNMEVDHINGNGLDNRRANLRVCTHQQNIRNQRVQKKNVTGYKGVGVVKRTGKYKAYIKVNGNKLHLKCWNTAIEAAMAYNEAASLYFGSFARLNEIG